MAEHPDWVRRFHLGEHSVCGHGLVEIQRGPARRARLVARLLRLPKAAELVPVHVQIIRGSHPGGPEKWVRQIGSRHLKSRQLRETLDVRERFGLLELAMRLELQDTGLRWHPAGAALRLGRCRMALPRWCAPQASAGAWSEPPQRAGVDTFSLWVSIRTPATGLLLSYSGQIEEDDHE